MTPPIVPPTGPTPPTGPHAPRPVTTPDTEGFAQVYDLALARARRTEPVTEPVIPVTVLEEMEAASRMFHALHAQGHELRFDSESDRVRAELRTVDGDVVRQVSLSEAIDVSGDPDFAA
jgi:hypothetical protein